MKYLAILVVLATLISSCGGGQEARLVGTEGSVSVARDIATYQQLATLDLGSTFGKEQIRSFLETGALYLVPVGTHVRVIETTDDYSHIEITEGNHSGATGYVYAGDVQK